MPTKKISFKISGKVQGVFFRKYTKKKADLLNIQGWCQNTSDKKSVIGEAQGELEQILKFEKYLREEGSPKSRIDGAVIKEIEKLERYDSLVGGFSVVR